DSLLGIMRAGRGTPFARRFETLTPAIEHAFDLTAILQLSVGPSWSSLQPADQNTLLTAFRRYTIANYVNSFDNYTGQRFDVQPPARGPRAPAGGGGGRAQRTDPPSGGTARGWPRSRPHPGRGGGGGASSRGACSPARRARPQTSAAGRRGGGGARWGGPTTR